MALKLIIATVVFFYQKKFKEGNELSLKKVFDKASTNMDVINKVQISVSFNFILQSEF